MKHLDLNNECLSPVSTSDAQVAYGKIRHPNINIKSNCLTSCMELSLKCANIVERGPRLKLKTERPPVWVIIWAESCYLSDLSLLAATNNLWDHRKIESHSAEPSQGLLVTLQTAWSQAAQLWLSDNKNKDVDTRQQTARTGNR